MATAGPMQYGVTAPLSSALPTESENQASNDLIEELKRQNNYESTSDTNKRYVVTFSYLPFFHETPNHIACEVEDFD